MEVRKQINNSFEEIQNQHRKELIELEKSHANDRLSEQIKTDPRVEEIFMLIKQKIDENNLKSSINSCVIAGQGINSINKSEKTAEEILQTSVKFGNSKTANLIKSECLGAYGIVKYVSNIKHSKHIGSKVQEDIEQTFFENVVQSFKSLLGTKPSKLKK